MKKIFLIVVAALSAIIVEVVNWRPLRARIF